MTQQSVDFTQAFSHDAKVNSAQSRSHNIAVSQNELPGKERRDSFSNTLSRVQQKSNNHNSDAKQKTIINNSNTNNHTNASSSNNGINDQKPIQSNDESYPQSENDDRQNGKDLPHIKSKQTQITSQEVTPQISVADRDEDGFQNGFSTFDGLIDPFSPHGADVADNIELSILDNAKGGNSTESELHVNPAIVNSPSSQVEATKSVLHAMDANTPEKVAGLELLKGNSVNDSLILPTAENSGKSNPLMSPPMLLESGENKQLSEKIAHLQINRQIDSQLKAPNTLFMQETVKNPGNTGGEVNGISVLNDKILPAPERARNDISTLAQTFLNNREMASSEQQAGNPNNSNNSGNQNSQTSAALMWDRMFSSGMNTVDNPMQAKFGSVLQQHNLAGNVELAGKLASALDTVSSNQQITDPSNIAAIRNIQPVSNFVSVLNIHSPVMNSGWGQEVGQRLFFMVNQQLQNAELQLHPKHLGPMEVKITNSDQQFNISFTTHHASVKEALDSAIPRLREMFAEQGLNLGDVNVSSRSPQQHAEQQSGLNHGNNQMNSAANIADEQADLLVDELTLAQRGIDGLVDVYA